MGILLYPIFLVIFWYRDFFVSSVRVSSEILIYAADLLSVPLLIRTFFKPLKSEYRAGLVWFSIAAGIFVKSIVLIVSLAILLVVVVVLLAFNLAILLLPIFVIYFVIASPF